MIAFSTPKAPLNRPPPRWSNTIHAAHLHLKHPKRRNHHYIKHPKGSTNVTTPITSSQVIISKQVFLNYKERNKQNKTIGFINRFSKTNTSPQLQPPAALRFRTHPGPGSRLLRDRPRGQRARANRARPTCWHTSAGAPNSRRTEPNASNSRLGLVAWCPKQPKII